MAARLERPDDRIFQIRAVFLGPETWTLLWQARYLAYAVWGVLITALVGIEYLTGTIHGFPIWTVCLSVIGTWGVMQFVDHDVPLSAVLSIALTEATTPRRRRRFEKATVSTASLRWRDEVEYARQAPTA